MKKTILLISALTVYTIVFAQREYWGVTFAGGDSFVYNNQQGVVSAGLGTIFKTDKYGNHQKTVYSFDSLTGVRPIGSPTQATNGKLYGFATQGGDSLSGCFYEFDPVTYAYRVIKHFYYPSAVYNNLNSRANAGKPLLASNGKIYGTCLEGEILPFPGCPECPPVEHGYTKIFEYDPVTGVFTNVYSFPETTAITNGTMSGTRYGPGGPCSMMQALNGKVYISFQDGLETFGGFTTAIGRLYEFIPGTNQVTLLNSYRIGNGAAPGGRMIEYSPGILYNTFNYGANEQMNRGGIHKYDIATNTMSIVAYVDTITGGAISGSLVKAGNKLYGTTSLGGWAPTPSTPWYERRGIIFEFDPATNTIKKLYDYAYENQPANIDTIHNPYYPDPNYYTDWNGLGLNLLAFNDTLFGISQQSMFWYKISTGELRSLLNFAGLNGYYPQSGDLIQTCTSPYYKNFSNDTTIVVQPGTSFSFTLHTPNTEFFHWEKNDLFISDTDSILNFTSFSVADTGKYVCSLTNECGTVITKTIYLKPGTAAPVTLLNFAAQIQNSHTTFLSWQTGVEINNCCFIIERSTDGIQFTNIGLVNGNGTTDVQHEYTFYDLQTPRGKVYYRLKQFDQDGKFNYSPVEFIDNGGDYLSVIHSPQSNSISVHWYQQVNEPVLYKLISMNGQLVKSGQGNVSIKTINVAGISSGVYQLLIMKGSKIFIHKIFIQNQ